MDAPILVMLFRFFKVLYTTINSLLIWTWVNVFLSNLQSNLFPSPKNRIEMFLYYKM